MRLSSTTESGVPLSKPSIQHSSAILNLRRLVILRNIAIAGQTVTVLVTAFGLGIDIPLGWLGTIIVALAVFNFITWRRLPTHQPHESELLHHLLVDVAALTLLLLLTGGATNPFAWLLLLPLTIAATVLSRRETWLMAALTGASYCMLMVFYQPLPHLDLNRIPGFHLYVIGMWIGFIISAGTVAYFVAGMAETLRARDRALAEARERELRDDHLVGLGTLAAGAAHEIGTPLGTMAILVNDMAEEAEAANDEEELEKLDILSEQIDRCKKALSVIAASAGDAERRSGRAMPVNEYLRRVIDEWRKTCPGVEVDFRARGDGDPPWITSDDALTQALANILQNAADASPEQVLVRARWDGGRLSLDIIDHGIGMSPEMAAAAGRSIRTTKGAGHGLGLYLSRAVIERLGGEMNLISEEGRGTCARIQLLLKTVGAVEPERETGR